MYTSAEKCSRFIPLGQTLQSKFVSRKITCEKFHEYDTPLLYQDIPIKLKV